MFDTPYPKSCFFEMLRQQDRNYQLIDTKAILGREMEKGEMDRFFKDDSHWSSKASEAIFKEVRFE